MTRACYLRVKPRDLAQTCHKKAGLFRRSSLVLNKRLGTTVLYHIGVISRVLFDLGAPRQGGTSALGPAGGHVGQWLEQGSSSEASIRKRRRRPVWRGVGR